MNVYLNNKPPKALDFFFSPSTVAVHALVDYCRHPSESFVQSSMEKV